MDNNEKVQNPLFEKISILFILFFCIAMFFKFMFF